MKASNKPLFVFCIALAICGRIHTNAQPPTSSSTNGSVKYKAFLGGEMHFGSDLTTIDVNAFICTFPKRFDGTPLKKGDPVAGMISDDQAWSIAKEVVQVGTNQIDYPSLAMVKCSDGFHQVVPAVLKAKTDIKAGGTLKSDGYQIEAKRAIKASDSISVLLVGDSLLSVEAVDGAKDKSTAKPWFTAYKDNTKASDRAALVEAWRIVNEHVGR